MLNIIPNNLGEAVTKLKKKITYDEYEDIVSGKINNIDLHMTVGVKIRNEWGLISGSNLCDYFLNLGLFHPDDMSGIILEKLFADIRCEKFNLTERINFYREYWVDLGIDVDAAIEKKRKNNK